MSGLLVELRAVDAARNIHRAYAVELLPDLFGAFIVETRWGRVGAQGRARRVAFNTAEEAERHADAALKRRASSQRRIGVAYRTVTELR